MSIGNKKIHPTIMSDEAEADNHNQKSEHLPSHPPEKWGLVEGQRGKSEAGTTTKNIWRSERKSFPHKLLTGK